MAKTEIEAEFQNGKLIRQDEPYNYQTDELVVEFTGTQIKQTEFGKSIEEPYTYSVSGDKINYTEDNKPKTITIKSQSNNNLVLVVEETDIHDGITYKEVVETSFVKK